MYNASAMILEKRRTRAMSSYGVHSFNTTASKSSHTEVRNTYTLEICARLSRKLYKVAGNMTVMTTSQHQKQLGWSNVS